MIKIILLILILITTKPIIALDATNSANKIEDVKGILRQIVSKDQPTDNSNDSSDEPSLKAFLGNITKVNPNEIILNSQNETKVILTNQDTTCVDNKHRQIKIDDLKEGQTILTMGTVNTDKSLDCRRIVITDPQSVINTHQIITGQIVDVSQSENSTVFVLIPAKNKNNQYQIKIDSKTTITDSKDKALPSTKNIVSGKKIIAVIKPDSQIAQTFYAVRLIALDSENTDPLPSNKP